MFVYSSYWRAWSRVLGHNPQGQVVELDLTPIGGHPWGKVGQTWVRSHSTPRRAQDRIVATLPDEVIEQMTEAIGPDTTKRLLEGDFLPLIDWEKYKRVVNGGAALKDCCKDECRFHPGRPATARWAGTDLCDTCIDATTEAQSGGW